MDRPKGGRSYIWYEFIMEGDRQKRGEIYKWRALDSDMGNGPSSLELYITNQLVETFKKVLCKIKDKRYKVSRGRE